MQPRENGSYARWTETYWKRDVIQQSSVGDLSREAEATEATVEQQELYNEDVELDTIGSMVEQYVKQHLVVQKGRRPKEMVGPRRIWPPTEKNYVAPFLQWSRDIFVKSRQEQCFKRSL
jgi:hypothetical protein